jgi:RNA polymerase sigma-70 factor (ECF subfamily)
MEPPRDPAEQVLLAAGGDRAAREALARRWLPAAYGAALAVLGRAADAEDATQEAFLRAFASLGTLRDPGAFGPWLVRIARNAALDRRKRPRERPLPELAAPAHDESAEDAVAAWRRLPEEERLVAWWRIAEGMPFREIATLLGTSKSAVDRTFRRALERMRREVTRC